MEYCNYVNILQGTENSMRYSNGNTLPLVSVPFGMNGFSIQTTQNNWNWFFHPNSRSIEGIRLTHQPSPWIGDYGHFVFMPQNGDPYIQPDARWSGYKLQEAILHPYYMKIDFLRYNATLELTPGLRSAAMKIHWTKPVIPRLAFFPSDHMAEVHLDRENRLLTGCTTGASWQVPDNFSMYFAVQFDTEIDIDNTFICYNDGNKHQGLSGSGIGCGINIAFRGSAVQAKLATSFISTAQAKCTLEREALSRTFNEMKEAAKAEWEDKLSRIQVECEEEEQYKTFYSCMYRMFLFPRTFFEISPEGKEIYYSAYDGKTKQGKMFTDNGFWDTYRTVYPLFALILKDQYRDILEGYVNFYKDCGWLPKWPSPGETGVMPGTLIDAVIADAAVKGICEGDLLKLAYEGMLKHATQDSGGLVYGRHGTDDYLKYKYIPSDLYRESANHTMDYAYGDFCIAQTARVLGDDQRYREFMERAGYYKNLYDEDVRFLRGKDSSGNRNPHFDPLAWGGEYTEGSAWQNAFAVYHDIDGLADLLGGKASFLKVLDTLFSTPPEYHVGSYEREIHEMTEMASVDFFQCAISNQPSFHLPYLYSALGEREKTVYWVKKLLAELFSSGTDGFPGDEDNGSMSGWYIFSSLGFYPICPGKNEYVLGSPAVKKATLVLGNDTEVTICHSQDMSPGSVMLNGQMIEGNTIHYNDLVQGGTLAFQ